LTRRNDVHQSWLTFDDPRQRLFVGVFDQFHGMRPQVPSLASSAAIFGSPPAGGDHSTWTTSMPQSLRSPTNPSSPTLMTLTSSVSRRWPGAPSCFVTTATSSISLVSTLVRKFLLCQTSLRMRHMNLLEA